MALIVKNPPANAGDTRDTGLIPCEDPLVEGMATHFSILDGESHGQRSAWWAAVHRVAQSRTRLKRLSMHVRMRQLPGPFLVAQW